MRSSAEVSTGIVAVAPKRTAVSRRLAGPPTVSTVPAPQSRATAVANTPSAPPWTTTVAFGRIPPERATARSTVLPAQPDIDAQVSATSSGSRSFAAPGVT